ncbi:MAG: hypothetical protein QG641_2457 [Candidatus Poribacteria bacterium]|nr:hypothetical protein [Candidatus Poribacteria bacterium]
MSESTPNLLIGWASRDVTPNGKVSLCGQFHIRLTEEVHDPLTVTALALESSDKKEQAIIVSLDAVAVAECVMDGCRERLSNILPEFRPDMLLISATHTHTAPDQPRPFTDFERPEMGDDVVTKEAYANLLIEKISEAAVEAWSKRVPGALSWGRGYAVVGFNRRTAYFDGATRMYGKTDATDFSHIEGHEDHAVELLFTYDPDHALTGVIVNVPCPSQCTESAYFISADYWHETRQEIRRRLGSHVHTLPQCSAAGDISPHPLLNTRADARMLRLEGYGDDYGMAKRRNIANKLASLVNEVLLLSSTDIQDRIRFRHRNIPLNLPRRRATEADLADSMKLMTLAEEQLASLASSDPMSVGYSSAFASRAFYRQVIGLYHAQQRGECLSLPTELHVLRIGDVAMCSNRFEYYLDYGDRIKGRSKALQTFVVQLAGDASYLPTERSIHGGSYGAFIAGTAVGPDGGQQVVDVTVAAIDELFSDENG